MFEMIPFSQNLLMGKRETFSSFLSVGETSDDEKFVIF